MTQTTQLKNSDLLTYKSINQISLNFAFENEELLKELNEEQQLRLYKVKNIEKTYKLTINEIADLYIKWVSQNEYVKLIYGEDLYLKRRKRRVLYVKVAKRGNDIYVWRSKKRIELLDLAFTKYDPERIGRKYIASNIIWFVLTFKRDDLRKDWQNERKYINEFMKKIRRINVGTRKKPSYPFKNAKIIERTCEAQNDGYIHINLIVFLGDKISIIGKRYKTKKGEIRYIIENEIIRELFKSCWKYGFADVGVLAKIKDKNYFTKYITKTIKYNEKNNKHILTLSLNWFFRKRSFYINYKILEFLFNIVRLDNNMCNDPKDEDENDDFFIREKVVLAKNMDFDPEIWFYEDIEIVKGFLDNYSVEIE
jgi:hypothetical protein